MVFCSQCGTSLDSTAVFCTKCGTRVSSSTINTTGVKRTGRGVYIQHKVRPILSREQAALFNDLLRKMTKLEQYFDQIITQFQNNPRNPELMNIQINCVDAKFKVSPSEAEQFYNAMFFQYVDESRDVFQQMSKTLGIQVVGNVSEFAILVPFRPNMETPDLVPIFPMGTIWSFMYVTDFRNTVTMNPAAFAQLWEREKKRLSKEELQLLQTMSNPIPVVLQKEFVMKNAEQIVALRRKIAPGESWESGIQKHGLADAQRIKAEIAAYDNGPKGYMISKSFAPLTEGDALAITSLVKLVLSTQPGS